MGKKPHKKAAGTQTARQGNGVGTVPLAFARPSARSAPRDTTGRVGTPPKIAKTPRPSAVSLRVDEEQYPSRGCAPAMLGEAEPQGLAVTYSFDALEVKEPYSVAVRFVGVRVGVKGRAEARDRFDRVERIDRLVTGMGRVAITARVLGINAGEWKVVATPVESPDAASASGQLGRRVVATRTRFSQLAQGPSVRVTAWPALISLGAVVAIVLQALLADRADIDVRVVLGLSLVGCVFGFVGGKVWYLVLHHTHPREFVTAGACIQGFLVVALGTVALGAAVFQFPAGTLLDVTTPGVFLGMAIGRPGCFLTGCCAGRPTGSRWGVRSSDRRLAIRRFPVQLLEAATALVIGVVTLVLVLTVRPPMPGVIFVGALAAYTLGRQVLFPLRTESRTTTGRAVTMIACTLVLVAVIGTFLLA